jgi:hypothetical protein
LEDSRDKDRRVRDLSTESRKRKRDSSRDRSSTKDSPVASKEVRHATSLSTGPKAINLCRSISR